MEYISVDAVSCCKFYSVVIYEANCNINNYIILTTVHSHYHHFHSSDSSFFLSNVLMHTISVNISALSQCQVGDKQEWSDKSDYIILGIATLLTCNWFCKNFSSFNKIYRYIRQRYKICMLWCFITWYIQNSARQPLWDNGTIRQQAANISMWCCPKITYRYSFTLI